MNKCQPLALGVAIGVLWAVYAFFVGITAMFGWGNVLVETLASATPPRSSGRLSVPSGLSWTASLPAS
jgi:hypothetical protein